MPMNFFDDGPLGHWQERFTFGEEWGCASSFVGFVLFLIAVLVLWRYLLN